MKRFVMFLLALLLIAGAAYALSRSDRSIPTQAVVSTGGVSINSVTTTLGNSCFGGLGSGYTATQVSSTSRPCVQAVVCGPSTNKNLIYVGGSGVTFDVGIPLQSSGDRQCVTLPVDNVNMIYAGGKASNDKVTVTYVDFV